MRTSKVAKRYAKGLLDFSQETGNTDLVFGEMKVLVKTIEQSKDLNALFNSPFIDSNKKVEITQQIFTNFSKASKNFIALVVKQGREAQLAAIASAYIESVEALHGVQRISLTSAVALSEANIDQILKSTNLVDHSKTFDIQVKINPEILGGYILRVGDQQIDASVRTKLSNIKKEFELN
ncbi:ATP synthase F1 subunit delta [Elizabethkingia sp. JS20170427COW]|uniref:ATP synthase F1 subunit delta n=1 Tax=Elizabethkingia sp. JS20170427COW TaxID=2583851 RepID=UPI001110E8C3|nr:ATP synthase F1 subunit delta [Elizabethkingia sp. JS20170427COW]QCX52594.1 ATP synthase F1 subunit delta [Elizabethkingia sp. JS20170427COW]